MSFVDFRKLNSFPEYLGHEFIVKIDDPDTGLHGFIAVHNTHLGPALGGTRMFPYSSEDDALRDVLRLSRTMSYKCALAGVKYGGGKAVIIGDSQKDKTDELLRSYAREIGKLNGKFFTGEDIGINKRDVQEVMLSEASFFIGKPGQAEDPSPFASKSCFIALKIAVRDRMQKDTLVGLRVAVKGVGKVGSELVRFLKENGASVVIADIDPSAVSSIKEKFPDVDVATPEHIHEQIVDVYSPCAMGNEITKQNKEHIRAKIICGVANNQLESEDVGDWLFTHDIVYIPDYVANAGGLIDVADELEPGGFQKERVEKRIEQVSDTTLKILDISKKKNEPTNRVANMLAEHIFGLYS